MQTPTAIDREWILSEWVKIIELERSLASMAKTRAESPPHPTLAVLYHETAAAEERHVGVLEAIATRYGYTPSRNEGGALGATFGRFKEQVAELGTSASDRLIQDLRARADAIHGQTAWVYTFQSLGDTRSADDLAAVLAEDLVHRGALQDGLNRMVEQRASGEDKST
jgi:hypothetical protein